MTTDRTAIRRRLAVRRTAHRPPWGGRKAGHRSIVAPLAATFAATVAVGVGIALAKVERERRAVRTRRSERNSRRFGLLAEETPADGMQRIALSQLDFAIELVRGETKMTPEEVAHETRKALKRLRALLRLLEGELGRKRARRERAVLREAAGRLAGARDAEVMVSTLDEMLERHPRKLGHRRGLIELRAHLECERRAASARTLGDDAAIREQVAAELCALRARVRKWKLPDRPAGRLAGPGLEHIYRAGGAGAARAGKHKPSPRTLHRWRKHVKDLRYALEVLDVRDRSNTAHKPSGKRRDKRVHKRLAKLIRRADRLGELLGEEHDLMLLGERVRSYKPLKRHRRSRKLLLGAISQRRAQLRKRALRDGERLYERKPRRFVRRVRA